MVTIPFDLETAKRIREGKIPGQIVTEKGQNKAEIVYEDDLCKERLFGDKRRMLQSAHATFYRIRVV